MSDKQKIISVLQKEKQKWLCNTCIGKLCEPTIHPLTVNAVCKELEEDGDVKREKTQCGHKKHQGLCKRDCNQYTRALPSKPSQKDVDEYLKSLKGQVICDSCLAHKKDWDLETVREHCNDLYAKNQGVKRYMQGDCIYRTDECKVATKYKWSEINDTKNIEDKMTTLLENLINDFSKIFAGKIPDNAFETTRFVKSNESVIKLKRHQQAIYLFCDKDGSFLKIGKAGPKSNPRYVYQHYDSSAKRKSTLAKTLLNDGHFKETINIGRVNAGPSEADSEEKTKSQVAQWMRDNLYRANITMDRRETGVFVLNLLESYLHLQLNPVYEKG